MHGKHDRYQQKQSKCPQQRPTSTDGNLRRHGNLIGTRPNHWTCVFTSEIHGGLHGKAFAICHAFLELKLVKTRAFRFVDATWAWKANIDRARNDRTGPNPLEGVLDSLETELED